MTPFPSPSLRAAPSLPVPSSLRSVIRALLAATKWRQRALLPAQIAQAPPAPEDDFKLELERRLLGQ